MTMARRKHRSVDSRRATGRLSPVFTAALAVLFLVTVAAMLLAPVIIQWLH